MLEFFFPLTLQLAVPKRDARIQQRLELQREVDALKVSLEKQVEGLHVDIESIVFGLNSYYLMLD